MRLRPIVFILPVALAATAAQAGSSASNMRPVVVDPPAIAAASVPALGVAFSGQSVHVTGVTQNGQLAIVACMREASRQMFVRMTDVQRLLTDSGSGVIDFDLGRVVPTRSIWAVVDLSSGRYTVATPQGFPRLELPFPASALKTKPSEDEDDQLINNHFVLEMLWVHPGDHKSAGAWFTRVADGGDSDEDGKNDGKATVSASRFVAIGSSGAAPRKIKKGDILVMIDPFEMQFFATQVGGQ